MTSFAKDVADHIKVTSVTEVSKIFWRYFPIWVFFVISALGGLGYSIYKLSNEYRLIRTAVANHHGLDELIVDVQLETKTTSLNDINTSLIGLKSSLKQSGKNLYDLTKELSEWAEILESDIEIFRSSNDMTPFGILQCDPGLTSGRMRLNIDYMNFSAIEGKGIDLTKGWVFNGRVKDTESDKFSTHVVDQHVAKVSFGSEQMPIDGSIEQYPILATLSPVDYVQIAPKIHQNMDRGGCGYTLASMRPMELENVSALFDKTGDFSSRLSVLTKSAESLNDELNTIFK